MPELMPADRIADGKVSLSLESDDDPDDAYVEVVPGDAAQLFDQHDEHHHHQQEQQEEAGGGEDPLRLLVSADSVDQVLEHCRLWFPDLIDQASVLRCRNHHALN